MTAPLRVTGPLLDILELLLRAWQDREELDGWRIMREARLTGPTVYRALDQLEDRGWVTGVWDEQGARPGRPRVRRYRLTPTGSVAVRDVVADHTMPTQGRPRRWAGRPGLAQLSGPTGPAG